MERNPNHHVTAAAHEHWHKIVAVILHKHRDVLGREVRITPADIEAMTAEYEDGMPNIVLEDRDGALRLRLVDSEEGARLARKEGGLPS